MKLRDTLRSIYLEAGYHLFDLLNGERAALQAIKEFQARTQMVFCVSNGRSGTRTLSQLFSCISAAVSEHEGHPGFHWVMRRAQTNPNIARQFWLYSKFPAVVSISAKVYVDTSHLFCKGFFEPLIDLGIVPSLVMLRRNRRAIASSLHALDTIPGRTSNGLKFYLSPEDGPILSIKHWRKLSDYQLCYWHTLETEARQRAYGRICREHGGRVVEIDLDDLNRPENFFDLVEPLGIKLDALSRQRISNVVGSRFNRKTNKKHGTRLLPDEGELEEAERTVDRLVTTSS